MCVVTNHVVAKKDISFHSLTHSLTHKNLKFLRQVVPENCCHNTESPHFGPHFIPHWPSCCDLWRITCSFAHKDGALGRTGAHQQHFSVLWMWTDMFKSQLTTHGWHSDRPDFDANGAELITLRAQLCWHLEWCWRTLRPVIWLTDITWIWTRNTRSVK